MADSAKCQQYIIGLVPSGLIGHDLLNSFATSSFVCKHILKHFGHILVMSRTHGAPQCRCPQLWQTAFLSTKETDRGEKCFNDINKGLQMGVYLCSAVGRLGPAGGWLQCVDHGNMSLPGRHHCVLTILCFSNLQLPI